MYAMICYASYETAVSIAFLFAFGRKAEAIILFLSVMLA